MSWLKKLFGGQGDSNVSPTAKPQPKQAQTTGARPLIQKDMFGNNCLGDLATVQKAVSNGANVNAKAADGDTPLTLAARNGNPDEVAYLISRDANVNVRDRSGRTPLFLAAVRGNLDMVTLLIAKGADVNSVETNDKRRTPLLWPVKEGYLDVVKCLVQNGANVNATDKEGTTALILAADRIENSRDMVTLLMDSGADVNAKNDEGDTPLLRASANGHLAIVERMVSAGADINAKNNLNITPLIWAAQYGHLHVLQFLMDKGADGNIRDQWGRTPLIAGAEYGRTDVVKYLVEHDADIGARQNDGKTALMEAKEDSVREILIAAEEKAQIHVNHGTPTAQVLSPDVAPVAQLPSTSDIVPRFEEHLKSVPRVQPGSPEYASSDYSRLIEAVTIAYFAEKAFVDKYWQTDVQGMLREWVSSDSCAPFFRGDRATIDGFRSALVKRARKHIYERGDLSLQFEDIERSIQSVPSMHPTTPFGNEPRPARTKTSAVDAILAALELDKGNEKEGCWQVIALRTRDAGRQPVDWDDLDRMVRAGASFGNSWNDFVLAQIKAKKGKPFPTL